MKFKVTFIKEFEGKDVEDCCGNLITYLHRCVRNASVYDFDFVKLPNEDLQTLQKYEDAGGSV
jgi:hypothetical protein